MSDVYEILRENLTHLRKAKKLTQAELADILLYSDKTISKWEKGMTVPSLDIILKLSEFYGVSLQDLLTKQIDTSEIEKTEQVKSTNKVLIYILALTFVWTLAVLIQVFNLYRGVGRSWLSYIWALPASGLISLIMFIKWRKHKLSFTSMSILLWTLITAIYLTTSQPLGYLLYIVGTPIQVIIILSYSIKYYKFNNKSKTKKGKQTTK